MAGLSWSVKLDDKISSGANAASAALGALATKLKETRERKRLFDTEMARATAQASKSGAAADTFRQATGLEATRAKATEAARAMDRLRSAARAAAAAPLLNGRASFGKTDANGAGLFAGARKELSLFSRVAQAAGGAFGDKGAQGVMAVGRALDFVGTKAKGLRGTLSSLAMGATAAVAAVAAVATGGALALGRWVGGIQSFKQQSLFSLSANLKSAEQGAVAWAKIQQIAISTGSDLRETGGALNGLLSGGFKLDEADELLRVMADMRALDPTANLEGIALAIKQIKMTGKLQGDELNQLGNAVSVDAIYGELAKKLGKTKEEVIKLKDAGKIGADDAIDAIKAATLAKTGMGAGGLAEKMANSTLVGQLGKAAALAQTFAASLNIDFAPIGKFLDRVGVALKGDAGKKFGASIEKAFSAVFGILDGISAESIAQGFTAAARVIDGVAAGANGLASALKTVDGWLTSAGAKTSAWGAIFEGTIAMLRPGALLITMVEGVRHTIDLIKGMIGELASSFDLSAAGSSIGGSFVSGIVGALQSGVSAVFGAAFGLGNAANSGTAAATQTASPSKTAGRLGGYYVDGYVDPLLSRAGEVRAAGASLGAAANAGAGGESVGARLSGRGGIKAPVGVQREGGSFADMYPQLFAAYRSPAEAAAAPSSAASIGTAAANVTNNTTTASRGPVSLQVTVQNADEAKIAGLIESRFRAMDLVGG